MLNSFSGQVFVAMALQGQAAADGGSASLTLEDLNDSLLVLLGCSSSGC